MSIMGAGTVRVAATWALLLLRPPVSAGCAGHAAAGLRLNHAQVLATHNSYHVAPADSFVAEWNYTHPSLDTQLDRGIRSFELDVFYDADAEALRVMHVPGSDEASNCATLSDCLQLASSWSTQNSAHFPLHFIVEMKGGVEMSDLSGCTYSDVQPTASCIEQQCVGSAALQCASAVQVSCQAEFSTVIFNNFQCQSLVGCFGLEINAHSPDHIVTLEDVEDVLRNCTSEPTNHVVSLDSAGQSDALAAVRAALDATFPAASRVVPEDVQYSEDVYVWPEVDSSRGKAMFYVQTPTSWGQGDSAGYFFGDGGAMVVENDPSILTGVAGGRWVRTRVDEQLQFDVDRQAQALTGGAQVLSTDFPPRVGPSWATLESALGSGVFWIPGGAPVGCNPLTVPNGVECTAALLEDLASNCGGASTTAETAQASTPGAATTPEPETARASTSGAAATSEPPQEGPREPSTTADTAQASTWGAATASEPQQWEDVVVVRMTVTGIDYSLLIANADLLTAMTVVCVGAVADAAGVQTSSVAVEFSPSPATWPLPWGSVFVTASITVPPDQTAAGVSERTFTSSLDDSLVGQINGISGIDAVEKGEPIGVVVTSVVGTSVMKEAITVSSGSVGSRHVFFCPLVASLLIFSVGQF